MTEHDDADGFLYLLSAALLALAIVLLTGCATGPALRTAAQQRAAAVEVAVACLDASVPTDPESGIPWRLQVGSGVLIDSRHVLTARHVVNCDVITVLVLTAGDADSIVARVDAVAPQSDLARLELDAPVAVVPAVVGRADLVACAAMGHPVRLRTCGLIIQERKTAMQDLGVQIESVFGNSGSALYDLAGRLVGIVTHKCRTEGCTYGTAIEPRRWILVTPEVAR